ncbi:MAG: FAD-binding oxidoreductase [Thaumarchaeota archaeon]|nr:FAD-binding oxidoreductase [Nitrososphaerota archaeon]
MDPSTLTTLKGEVRGEVILPEDAAYEQARRVYNAMIDKRPAVVVRCVDAGDVMAALKAARKEGLSVSIRGGGHSVPGFGTADDALVVDLSRMKGIRVDPASRTVRAEGGCTWGDLNHATYGFGSAVPGGIISTTGIAGLTLGGGFGYLSRGAGLSLDNLISADVVLADGSFVKASEKENPELFWAMRGGGGNFGLVTSFKYRISDVKDIVGGPMFFEVKDAPAVMRAYDKYINEAPRQLGAFFAWQIAPPLPFIPQNRHGDTFCAMVVCWTGPPDQASKAIAPLREAAPVVAEFVQPMPLPTLNSLFDALLPPGLQHYWKAVFARDLSDGAIEAHMKFGPKVPVVNSTTHIYSINGAVHDVGPDATAFGHRDAKYAVVIAGMWPDPAQNEKNVQWVRDYYKALAPYSEEGGYINFAAGDDMNRVAANFGRNYGRLQAAKRKYDPENVFHINQNIAPA